MPTSKNPVPRGATAALSTLIAAFALLLLPSVSAAAPGAEVGFDPDPLSFPATTAGQSSEVLSTRLTVEGSPLSVEDVSLAGADAGEFVFHGTDCGGFLETGWGCDAWISFAPGSPGAKAASLLVETSEGEASVALTGTAAEPQLAFQPGSYDFGLQQIWEGAETSFQLRNVGPAAARVDWLGVSGPGSEVLWVGYSDCYGTELAPGQSCTANVNFSPRDEVSYEATLEAGSSAGAPFSAELSGEGGRPLIAADPNPVDFGGASVGTPGAVRTIEVSNHGSLPGSFFVAVVAGGDSGSFQLLDESCSAAPLQPGASCEANVRFRPLDAGSKTARFALFGDGDSGAQIMLTGVGLAPDPSLTPGSHDFGGQPAGSAGPAESFVLANGGEGSVEVNGVSLVGADPDQFRIGADDCTGATVASGGSCELRVRFDPDSTGPKVAALRIATDAGPLLAALGGDGREVVAPAAVPSAPRSAALATTPPTESAPRVSFRWRGQRGRRTQRRGKRLLVGRARCHAVTGCRVIVRALLVARGRSAAASRRRVVALPATHLWIGPDRSRPLRFRLGRPAKLLSGKRARLRLRIVWRADDRRGSRTAEGRIG